nr:hypothetical protein [Tanacetum cinerariifolium]
HSLVLKESLLMDISQFNHNITTKDKNPKPNPSSYPNNITPENKDKFPDFPSFATVTNGVAKPTMDTSLTNANIQALVLDDQDLINVEDPSMVLLVKLKDVNSMSNMKARNDDDDDDDVIDALGLDSKPRQKGYRNTIELPKGNNVTRFKDLLQKVAHHGIDRWLQIQIFYDRVSFHLKCEIDRASGGKLRNKNADKSWKIIENLALYDHERCYETKEFVKPVKAISTPQVILKTPNRRLLELEDQINFLLRGSRPTPTPSSAHTPQAYINAVYSNSRPRNQNEPPTLSTFAFREPHTERMERFENTIFKQREEINGRMTEMFGLLNELTTSRTLEKVLIREEAKFPVTKNLNSISLTKEEEIGSDRTMMTPGNAEKPTETKTETPIREVEEINKVENRAKTIKTSENDKAVEAPGSQPVAYYLKHKINVKLIKGLVNNNRFNNSRSRTQAEKKKGKEYKVLPGGPLMHVSTLVDQGSDVNVMPYSTYMKLTDEKPAEIDIRLSLASHSYIYPLGIAEDVLVKIVEHVYPVDFVISDIRENENRPFIFGTPFLTTAKASIKFDTGTITLRPGTHKISFHRKPDSSNMIDKGVKNDIEPIAPTMNVNRLVREWEEKIKLHL